MKTARLLAVSLLLGGAAASVSRGDDTADSATMNPATDPGAYVPGTTPRVFTETLRKTPTQSELAQEKDRETAAQRNKNWLLDSYEQQLQLHAAAAGEDQSNNFYAQVSADKSLAKLAGLATPAPIDPAQTEDLHVGANQRKPDLSLRPDPAVTATGSNSEPGQTEAAFKPFITPLNSSEMPGLHDFVSQLAPLSPPPDAAATPPSATSDLSDPDTTDALAVPGMTAAENDPALRNGLALQLPDDPGMAPDRPHHDLALELPVAGNAERLQKQEAAAMTAPGQKPRTMPATAINPKLLPPVNDTAAMVTDPSPIRGQVADPYDILR